MDVDEVDVPLDRDVFLRSLVRSLSGCLEDVVGLEQASGFISVVGREIGLEINDAYRAAMHPELMNEAEVASVLVDLKRRIGGDFYPIEVSSSRIILGNRRCPFEDKVIDRPSMCMMTSNVFGVIAAENLGYARVVLDQTIAAGAPECRVSVFLTDGQAAGSANEREYYRP